MIFEQEEMSDLFDDLAGIQSGKVVSASGKPAQPAAPSVASGAGMVFGVVEALALFGHKTLRPGQEEAIEEALYGDKGALVVFPTGWGKSLVYQVPALVREGVSLIVSPLISLMKDQVDKMESFGLDVAFINSSVGIKKNHEVMNKLRRNEIKVLYVAPERFANDGFMQTVSNLEIGLMAIDESHCISRWGHDFRPAYRHIGKAIKALKPRQVLALTATATKKVQDDICESLGIPDAPRFVRGVYRPNLNLAAYRSPTRERMRDVIAVVKRFSGQTGIIYTPTRRVAENVALCLQRSRIKASYYHAGMNNAERTGVQDDWFKNGGVVVATCAFGMGIDRPDVRFVLHWGLSPSLEDWYQAVGRAGRDGKESVCISLWSEEDYQTQMMFVKMSTPSSYEVMMLAEWLVGFAKAVAVPGADTCELDMTQSDMGKMSGCVGVSPALTYLRELGLVTKVRSGLYRVNIKGNWDFDCSELDERYIDKVDKIKNMVSFYQSDDCRFEYVCAHFGDLSMNGSCKKCDNCKGA